MVDWFTPGYKAGGPIRSVSNVAKALKNNYQIYILTTDTDHGEVEPYKNISSDKWISDTDDGINIYYAKKNTLSANRLKKQILHVDPDYIYLNHLFSPYFVLHPLWLKFRGKVKSKIILCPRGALYESALSLKAYKKRPLLQLLKWMQVQKFITFHATNEREKSALENYFPESKIIVADNLSAADQPVNAECVKDVGSVRCIFIARIVPIKNLYFLLEVLEKIKSTVQLTVIGPIENKDYWEQCQHKIEKLPDNIRVNYEGAKNSNELLPIIQRHHLFILPTKGENYGHSIVESLIAGRPVLISDQTPWLDIETKKAGWAISLNNPAEFANVIDNVCKWDQLTFNEWSLSAWNYASSIIKNPLLQQSYFEMFS